MPRLNDVLTQDQLNRLERFLTEALAKLWNQPFKAQDEDGDCRNWLEHADGTVARCFIGGMLPDDFAELYPNGGILATLDHAQGQDLDLLAHWNLGDIPDVASLLEGFQNIHDTFAPTDWRVAFKAHCIGLGLHNVLPPNNPYEPLAANFA